VSSDLTPTALNHQQVGRGSNNTHDISNPGLREEEALQRREGLLTETSTGTFKKLTDHLSSTFLVMIWIWLSIYLIFLFDLSFI
jgi:hypothetical protein